MWDVCCFTTVIGAKISKVDLDYELKSPVSTRLLCMEIYC